MIHGVSFPRSCAGWLPGFTLTGRLEASGIHDHLWLAEDFQTRHRRPLEAAGLTSPFRPRCRRDCKSVGCKRMINSWTQRYLNVTDAESPKDGESVTPVSHGPSKRVGALCISRSP